MDAMTVFVAANTETVYAISHLALKDDGPTVMKAPPRMLGFHQDGLQRYLADIGPLGAGAGRGREIPRAAPRLQTGDSPAGLLRGALAQHIGDIRCKRLPGRRENRRSGVELMKRYQGLSTRPRGVAVREWSSSTGPDTTQHPVPECVRVLRTARNDRGRGTSRGFRPDGTMADAGHRHPEGRCRPDPTPKAQALFLEDAARLGGAMARANTYAPPTPDGWDWPDRKWQGALAGVSYACPQKRCPTDRCPQQRILHGRRKLTGDDGEERRTGLATPLDLPATPTATTSTAPNYRLNVPARHPDQQLLVGRRLRRPEPLGVTKRTAAAIGEPIFRSCGQQQLVGQTSPSVPADQHRESGSPPFRGGLVSDLPLLQPHRRLASTRPGRCRTSPRRPDRDRPR